MRRTYLVTGGAGFIGSNLVNRLLKRGEEVIVFDNLSRNGAKENLVWLESLYGKKSFEFYKKDIRSHEDVIKATQNANVIIHLAAQVAVTTSVKNPREDFEINALGTFNILEAARNSNKYPVVIFASTNKVYGEMVDLEAVEENTRYELKDLHCGVNENRLLDFHSPYGCSKGCGDQYVHDYSRIYQIPSVVFRQSCIYGTRQFGIEDQGWVAWFVIAALIGKKIAIYGNGKQVRDILYVEDLLDAYDVAIENIDSCAGEIYNIGGGVENTISIWNEFQPILEEIQNKKIPCEYFNWRPGDQKVYISDIRKINKDLGWKPHVNIHEGIEKLNQWVDGNLSLFDVKK